jgi:hypothetical protein
MLYAISGGRAPTATTPAVACGCLGAEVGLPLRALHLLGESLELPFPDLGEVAAALGRGRVFVEVDGDAESPGDLLPDAPRERDALLDGRAADRDERHDVHGSHSGVLSRMLRQIDARQSRVEERENRRLEAGGVSHEGQDAPVVRRVRGNGEEPSPRGPRGPPERSPRSDPGLSLRKCSERTRSRFSSARQFIIGTIVNPERFLFRRAAGCEAVR